MKTNTLNHKVKIKEKIRPRGLRKSIQILCLATLVAVTLMTEAEATKQTMDFGLKPQAVAYDTFFHVIDNSNWVENGVDYYWYKGTKWGFDFQLERWDDVLVKCKKYGTGVADKADGSFLQSRNTFDTGNYRFRYWLGGDTGDTWQKYSTWAALWLFNRSSNATNFDIQRYVEVDMLETYKPGVGNGVNTMVSQYNVYINDYVPGYISARRDFEGPKVVDYQENNLMLTKKWNDIAMDIKSIDTITGDLIKVSYLFTADKNTGYIANFQVGYQEDIYAKIASYDNTYGSRKNLNLKVLVQNRPLHTNTQRDKYSPIYIDYFEFSYLATTTSFSSP